MGNQNDNIFQFAQVHCFGCGSLLLGVPIPTAWARWMFFQYIQIRQKGIWYEQSWQCTQCSWLIQSTNNINDNSCHTTQKHQRPVHTWWKRLSNPFVQSCSPSVHSYVDKIIGTLWHLQYKRRRTTAISIVIKTTSHTDGPTTHVKCKQFGGFG